MDKGYEGTSRLWSYSWMVVVIPAFANAGPRSSAMNFSSSGANITILGVFFGLSGSFWTVMAADVDAYRFHPLDVLHEVIGISGVILRLEMTALQIVVRLH